MVQENCDLRNELDPATTVMNGTELIVWVQLYIRPSILCVKLTGLSFLHFKVNSSLSDISCLSGWDPPSQEFGIWQKKKKHFGDLPTAWRSDVSSVCFFVLVFTFEKKNESDPWAVVLPTASGMRKLYPSRLWCSREGMMPFRPIGLQSDCKGVILTNRGLWLDLRCKQNQS